MSSVDVNRLKGNYAEHTVASWLSRVALVRPVADGTDIGVDLYCESVIDSTPYLHFWIQVKAIAQSQISSANDNETAWFDFETKHLRYWARQPIPVYAFLVPVETWPPLFPTRIYGVRITDYVIHNEIPDQGQIRIRTPDWMDTETIEADLRQFITEIVPWDTSALLIQKGIIAPVPSFEDGLEKRFPAGIGFKYLDKILDSIRDTSIVGLIDALAVEHYQPDKRAWRKRFEAIAKLFESELHVFGMSVLVRAAHADGEIERAKAYIAHAIERVEQDTALDAEAKDKQLTKIRLLLDDFK